MKMSKDDFFDIMTAYIVTVAERDGNTINEGTLVHTPVFDRFLQFIKNGTSGQLKHAYNLMSPDCKMKYKVLLTKLERSEEVNIDV